MDNYYPAQPPIYVSSPCGEDGMAWLSIHTLKMLSGQRACYRQHLRLFRRKSYIKRVVGGIR